MKGDPFREFDKQVQEVIKNVLRDVKLPKCCYLDDNSGRLSLCGTMIVSYACLAFAKQFFSILLRSCDD